MTTIEEAAHKINFALALSEKCLEVGFQVLHGRRVPNRKSFAQRLEERRGIREWTRGSQKALREAKTAMYAIPQEEQRLSKASARAAQPRTNKERLRRHFD